jgi:hypothetical protein
MVIGPWSLLLLLLELNFSPYAVEIRRLASQPERRIIGLSWWSCKIITQGQVIFCQARKGQNENPTLTAKGKEGKMGIHLLALTMPKAIYFVKANLFVV